MNTKRFYFYGFGAMWRITHRQLGEAVGVKRAGGDAWSYLVDNCKQTAAREVSEGSWRRLPKGVDGVYGRPEAYGLGVYCIESEFIVDELEHLAQELGGE